MKTKQTVNYVEAIKIYQNIIIKKQIAYWELDIEDSKNIYFIHQFYIKIIYNSSYNKPNVYRE